MGPAAAVLLNAGSFLVSAACLVRIDAEENPRMVAQGRQLGTLLSDVAAGVRFVLRDPLLRPRTAFAAAANITYSGYSALTVLFLLRTAGLSPAEVGILMAATGVGGVCGAFAARPLGAWIGTARAQVLAALMEALGLLIPFTHAGDGVVWYVIGAVALGAGLLIGNIIMTAFRQAYCPPEMLGRVVAGMRFVAFGAFPLGALLGGALGTAIGVRDALWVFVGGLALSGTLLWSPAVLARRDLPGMNNTVSHSERGTRAS